MQSQCARRVEERYQSHRGLLVIGTENTERLMLVIDRYFGFRTMTYTLELLGQ